MKNHMVLEFDAISENESFARVAVAAFLASLDPTIEEMSDVKTAVSEAVTNAVIHAYPGELYDGGKIRIEAKIEGEELQISIIDTGIGIENVKRAMQPLYTTKLDEERSGMGFSFMEAFMDMLEVESTIGEGTTIHMCKRIGQECGVDKTMLV